MVACNVLGHVDDLDDFCGGVKEILAPDGAFVFEVPYLGELLSRLEYDTIYHEHLSYFAVNPLATLLNRHGLRLERVRFFPVHGGTIRGTAVHGVGVSPQVQSIINDEIREGIGTLSGVRSVAEKVLSLRTRLHEKLVELRNIGRKVIGYGAPAKGTVVLNYCDIGTDLVPVILDSTPAKQGLYVPGTHQLILPSSALSDQNLDVLLLLAWNHAEEIIERESAFKRTAGCF